ncbi:MAG TPA: histidine phosphatase family protein [Anaerolineaceae bacterium]|jgi:probable phosphoglycerate mutase|nr:histidine phosphatase family protein [Longilinea sp.]HQN45356.1 histidine phosphatase family protein [Anaerolineaceae bacterium]
MPTLLLIRHAANDVMNNRLAGRLPGIHLNALGRQQAADLARALAALPLSAVYASPLERAVETAAPLAAARQLTVQVEPGLNEVDYGSWQGCTYKSLRRRRLWQTLLADPASMRFPDGGTLIEAQQLAITTLEQIATHLPKNEFVACITHGDIIRLSVAHYLSLPLPEYHRLCISPASVTVLRLNESQPRVVRVNQSFSTNPDEEFFK